MNFPQPFFKILILAAIALMALGAITLVVMLLIDVKNKRIW